MKSAAVETFLFLFVCSHLEEFWIRYCSFRTSAWPLFHSNSSWYSWVLPCKICWQCMISLKRRSNNKNWWPFPKHEGFLHFPGESCALMLLKENLWNGNTTASLFTTLFSWVWTLPWHDSELLGWFSHEHSVNCSHIRKCWLVVWHGGEENLNFYAKCAFYAKNIVDTICERSWWCRECDTVPTKFLTWGALLCDEHT